MSVLWWLLSLFLSEAGALAGTAIIGAVAIGLIAAVYRRAEQPRDPGAREDSQRFRTVLAAARRMGRYNEVWEVTRRDSAASDIALFLEAERGGRLPAFLAEWDEALRNGDEDAFFTRKRGGAG